MSETTTDSSSIDQIQSAKPSELQAADYRSAAFLKHVDALLKGDVEHKNHVSGPVIEDLRAAAAQGDELRKQMQKVNETAQQVQGALMQAQGRADALLAVLHRLEGAA